MFLDKQFCFRFKLYFDFALIVEWPVKATIIKV